jgi:uncharacterized protein
MTAWTWLRAAAAVLATAALHAQGADPLNARLIAAAERGDVGAIRALLAQGAPIDARDDRGRTSLMAAVHADRVDAARALIVAGADVNIQDDRKDNPFLYAGAEGRLEMLRVLIDAGASTRIVNRFGGTALIPAAERGHVDIVRELLSRTDVAVDHVNNLGWTALLEAIVLSDGGPRHQQIVELLVAAGADVNIPDKNGATPLRLARSRGFRGIEAILRRAGARE